MPNEPKRNIAAEVAEKVMEWTSETSGRGTPLYMNSKGFTRFRDHWHPDINIADAWLVVEETRMWLSSKRQRFMDHLQEQANTRTWGEVQSVNVKLAYWLLLVPDLPRRICLAALAAVEEG